MKLQTSTISFLTIASKEVKRIVRIWPQTILPPIITISLYFIIFGTIIGTRIGQIENFNYMEFIVPGLIMMSIITNSYMNVSSSFFGNKFQRSIEEILVAPVSNNIIILGYIVGGIFRSIVVGTIVLLVSLFFTKLTLYNITLTILFAIMASVVFSLAGLINGIFARKFDDVSIVPTFVLTPLTYLGGVFYSINLLPPLFQTISKLNPIFYMVNGFRYGFLGISDINIMISITMLLIFGVVFYAVNLVLLNKGYGLKK